MTKTIDEIRELLCQICAKGYPIWFAPNEQWNAIMRYPDGREASESEGFVCMDCFANRAKELGVYDGAWLVMPSEALSKIVDEIIGPDHSCKDEVQPASIGWHQEHVRWVKSFNELKAEQRKRKQEYGL